MSLPARAWFPPNHQALLGWLERWTHEGARETAAFDFDNTTIFHDLGEAVMRLQLDELELKLDLAQLDALLPAEVSGIRVLAGGASLADAREDILSAYEEVLALSARGGPQAARGSAAHLELRTLLAWLYSALEQTPGIGARFAYPFLAHWLGGYTKEEVKALASRAVARAVREPIGFDVWRSEGRGRLGPVSARFRTGLAPLPEMRELMAALERAGVRVHVVSASQEQLVAGALEALDYPVPPERVFGMRLQEEGGKLQPRSVEPASYPLTYREGKREVIEGFFERPPVFVAGDSDTDYEMLTAFEQTIVRLLIRRDVEGAVRGLDDDERTLLQGRDEPKGCFRPARESLYLR